MDTKLEQNESLNKDGLGMGLAICKTIVEIYNGDIKVHSRGPQLGTTFTFSMQMSPAHAGHTSSDESQGEEEEEPEAAAPARH